MAKFTLTNQTTPSTPSSGTTEFYIDDTTKKVTTIDDAGAVTDYSASATPTWTAWSTVTILGGGTLTYTTANARYYIDGKILHAQFDFNQTAAGDGSADVTIAPPGGVTLLDSATCGVWGSRDLGNDNQFRCHAIEAINSTNVFKIRRNTLELYVRGNAFVGNNAKISGFHVTAAIS